MADNAADRHRKRADEMGVSMRHYLVGANAGGIGILATLVKNGELTSNVPYWFAFPALSFCFGLIVTGISISLQKRKALARERAERQNEVEPEYNTILGRNENYDYVSFFLFILGVLVFVCGFFQLDSKILSIVCGVVFDCHPYVANVTYVNWLEVMWGAGAGGVVGLALVFFVDCLKRVRINIVGFSQSDFDGGVHYKINFKVGGFSSPGLCVMELRWKNHSVFAKWDETPNPVHNDSLSEFRPELVPTTYYQPLMRGRSYAVPVLIEKDNVFEVFSGWWFGKPTYGPNPTISADETLIIAIYGNGLIRRIQYPVERIVRIAKARRRPVSGAAQPNAPTGT